MRTLPRLLVLTASVALVAAPLAAAEAASTYHVSVSVGPKLVDVSSESASARRTKIHGRVTGGPVRGQRVHLVAYNTSDGDKARDLGSAGLSSSGKFAKSWSPPVGGQWRIRAVKDASGSTAADGGSAMLDAFHWAYLYEFDRVDGVDQREGVQLKLGEATKEWRVKKKWFGESEYIIPGSSRAVFDTRGYLCKKIIFKIGVADRSGVKKGKYAVVQPSRTNGTHKILSHTMKRGQKAYDVYNHKSIRDRMRPTRTLEVRVYGSTRLRYVLGNAKVFCTFPSAND